MDHDLLDRDIPTRLVDAFHARTLPRREWTHEAHLVVCWYTLRERDVDGTVDALRTAIRSYNEATGTPNTETSGYHETLTRYYVLAIARHGGRGLDEVMQAPECRRDAPLRHWSRELLFSPTARRQWVEPDLVPLPATDT